MEPKSATPVSLATTAHKQHSPLIVQMEALQRIGKIGLWEAQFPSESLFWSDEMCRILGVDPLTTVPNTELFLSLVHPEDLQRVQGYMARSVNGDPVPYSEYRMVRPDGDIRHVSARMEMVRKDGMLVLYGTMQDITELVLAEQKLRESEERFKYAARATSDVIWDWDIRADHVWRSENVQALFGILPSELAQQADSWANRIHPEDRSRILTGLDQATRGSDINWQAEYRLQRCDGSYAYVLDRAFILRDAQGTATRMIGALVDLSESRRNEAEREAAEAQIRKQASLLNKTTDAIIVCALDSRVTFWNEGAARLYGWRADEAIGKPLAELIYQDEQELWQSHQAVLAHGEWRCESVERHKSGRELIVESHWTLVRDARGEKESIFVIKADITQRKDSERKIQHMAFHDSLTGLPNRLLFSERVQHAIAAGKRNKLSGAVLLLDLDDFKTLNDTLGHETGDSLLKQVAERLAGSVRKNDTVARLGGDEFVVLLDQLKEEDVVEAAKQVSILGEKILSAFRQPFRLEGGYDYYVTPSIGITLFGLEHETIDDILRRADLAMYQAKAAGRNTLRFFDPAMQAVVEARVALEADLRDALLKQQFTLYLQPQISCEGKLIGAEALLRWEKLGHGLIPPAKFIPLAESTGLILPIGQWVLESACRLLQAWSADPQLSALTIAVNVSAVQLRSANFVEQVLNVVAQTGTDPSKLKIELTESILVDNIQDSISKMMALKSHGVGIALDDFGTGYSSLSYLKRLPLDQLKIDQSFVRDLLHSKSDGAIAHSIISLGQSLGLSVVAEGVESAEQQAFLHSQGCPAYQGFYFAQPLPVAEFAVFARNAGQSDLLNDTVFSSKRRQA